MRIVIDINIAFSAVLDSDSKIGRIILHPKTNLNFYATYQLLEELEDHKAKLKLIPGYSNSELDEFISLVTYKIRFINIKLIPLEIFAMAETIVGDIDIDDTEFVALAEHAKAKLFPLYDEPWGTKHSKNQRRYQSPLHRTSRTVEPHPSRRQNA